MKNTLEILDNYQERAVTKNLNIVDVLDHIFAKGAKSKRRRAYEKQIQMSGFPIKKILDDFDFSFQLSINKLVTMRFQDNGENVVFLGPQVWARFKSALHRRKPEPGLIFHYTCGVQYSAAAFRKRLSLLSTSISAMALVLLLIATDMMNNLTE